MNTDNTTPVQESFGPIRLDLDGGVATVTVDSPPVNAMGRDVLEGLDKATARVAGDEGIRAVVLTAAGTKAFFAGAAITEFQALVETEGGMTERAQWAGGVLAAWAALPQPTIAAVQASAVGGGLEIALGCDLIYAVSTAKFGLPEVKLGLIPGGGGTQRLTQRVGGGRAMEMLLRGSVIDAARAEAIGLLNGVCEPGTVLDHARSVAAELAALPRVAVQAAKQAAVEDLAEGIVEERRLFLQAAASADFREGFAAFIEKRAPRFAHR